MEPVTPLAQHVAKQLREVAEGKRPASRKEELGEWYEKFRKSFGETEREELELLLGKSASTSECSFRELVPAGWLGDLLELVKECESPTPFFFLAGMTVLSQAVGRGVMIDRGTHKLGLDVSALLISPAGKGRRSTACDLVVYDIAEPAGLNIVADSWTYESFGDALVETAGLTKVPADRIIRRPRALVYAGEMSVLLGKGSYVDSIIPKLTDILGKTSRFEWRTVKRGGKIVFREPCINALFTSAPDWLVENLPPVVFGGGMLSRFLICVQDRMEKVVTWGDPLDAASKTHLVMELQKIARRRGEFGPPSEEAMKWYHNWYQKATRKYLDGDIPDPRMEPYYSRKHDHLLRMAALLALAAGDEFEFTVERLEQSLAILNWLEEGVPKAYAQMALSPIAGAQRIAVEVLRRNAGMMEHARLQKKMYRHTPLKEQFRAVMESLVEMRVVKVLPNLSKRGKSYMLVQNLE
jgi:hypothetical protein